MKFSLTALAAALWIGLSPLTSHAARAPEPSVYVPVLMYHHVMSYPRQNPYIISPAIFEQQMAWLKANNYHVVSFEDFYQAIYGAGTLPDKPVVLTFDDGHVDQYLNVVPVLKKYGYPGIFYVVGGEIGKKTSLSWDMLEKMKSDGFEIAAHTMTHPNLTRRSPKKVAWELSETKRLLETHLHIPIVDFAYPGGDFTSSTEAAVKAAGYRSAVATRHSVYHKKNKLRYQIRRVHIDDDMISFPEFVKGARHR